MNENNTPLNNGENRPRVRRPMPEQNHEPTRRAEDPSARPTRPVHNSEDAVPVRQPQRRSPAQRPAPDAQGRPIQPRQSGQPVQQGQARGPARPVRQNGPQRIPQPVSPSQGQRIPQPRATAPSQEPAVPVTRQEQKNEQAETERPTSSTSSVKKEDTKKKTTLSKAGAEMMSSAVKAIIYIVAVFVVAIFLSIIIIRVGNDVFALVKSDEAVDITIKEDATLGDVGQLLYENNIISFPGLFSFYGNLKGDDGVFIPGDYTVSPSMSYDDLREAFKPKPITGTSWITIPEGYTVDEIIALMESYGIGKRERYIEVINEYDFDYWFVKEIPDNTDRIYRLEGYLFPDTYEFYNNSSEVTVINKMLARFNEVVVQDYIDRVDELNEINGFTTDEQKLTFDDIIIIASMVEKEGSHAQYYSQISSVFHNRLKNPGLYPKMESDATTYYGLQVLNDGVRPEKLSADEIKTSDTPYNTYANKGLPPGAISNPSASAIRFALYPYVPKKAEGERDLYFFVEGPYGPYFASSMTEHQANIAKVKAENEAINKSED
ncbi:MAG: endolytic transglycosylase MltG [Clostridia bacterium]|nr:endolytic transglycosylase MltG [Clostridia bacterium]